jgi:hypothetical protein
MLRLCWQHVWCCVPSYHAGCCAFMKSAEQTLLDIITLNQLPILLTMARAYGGSACAKRQGKGRERHALETRFG